MYALQNLARAAPRLASTANQQTRSYLVSKPRVRISFAEKVGHGLILLTVPLVIPLYCATHYNQWRGQKD